MQKIQFQGTLFARIHLSRILARCQCMADMDHILAERKIGSDKPAAGDKFMVQCEIVEEVEVPIRSSDGRNAVEAGRLLTRKQKRRRTGQDRGDFMGSMIRKRAQEAGLAQKRFHDYSDEEIFAICEQSVAVLAAFGDRHPQSRGVSRFYPPGWEESVRWVCERSERLGHDAQMAALAEAPEDDDRWEH